MRIQPMIRSFSLFSMLCMLGFSAAGPAQAQLCFNSIGVFSAEQLQQGKTQDAGDTTFLRGSNRALIFSINGLSLDGLNGGIGAKWWLSSTSALRTTLNLSIQSQEDTNGTLSNSGRNSIDFGVTGFIELHSRSFGQTERLSPYVGAGLRFGAGAFSQKTDFPLGNETQQRKETGSVVEFEVLVGVGFEYRISRRVSLGGEHTFGGLVQKQQSDTSVTRDAVEEVLERDLTSFTLGTGTSSLILAVYF